MELSRGHKLNRVMEKIRHLLSTTQTSNPISINTHSKLHTPNHPPYALMIRRAIAELNEEGGSSEKAISKFIGSEYGVFPFVHDYFLRHHLRKLCERRELLCVNDGQYILPVGKEGKKKKRRRAMGKRMSKPSRVEGKDGEGTEGRETGEGSLTLQQDIERQTEAEEIRIEGNDEHKKGEEEPKEVAERVDVGKEENTEVLRELSNSERPQIELTEVQSERIIVELSDEGDSDHEKKFIKEKRESQKMNTGHTEAVGKLKLQNKVTEQQDGISLEQNEPQPQQTEVIEKQFQLAEVLNQQQQQDKETELIHKAISTSTLNNEDIEAEERQNKVLEEQQLEISSEKSDSQPQQTEVIGKQFQLGEVKRKQQQDNTKLNRKTRSTSAPTVTIPPVAPSGKGQQVDLEELSELPIMQVLPRLKSAKKKKLSLPQQQVHDQCQLQKRKLRSYNRSDIPELATDTSVMELPMLAQHQDEPQLQEQIQGEEKQCQQRCPKRKRDMDMDLEAELPLDSHHHKDQPLKCRAQEMPSKLRSDTDAIMEVVPPSVVQDQNERKMQCQGQLPQRILQSHNQEPSVSESAAPTMTLSSKPSEHQDEKQQQAMYQVLGKQERPRELKIDVEEQPPKRPGRGRPRKLKTELKEQQPKRPGRGRPRKLKTELKEQQPKRPVRGRPPKLKPSGGTSVEVCSSADVRDQKKQHQVAAKDGEETEGMEIEEVNLTLEQEIERQTEARGIRIEGNDEQKKGEEERQEVAAKVDEGEDENTEVIEEQSKSEGQQMEVIEVRSEMIIIGLSDEEVSCDEKQFVKENQEEREKLNKETTEVGEGQNEMTEPQLGISSEENEPQPQQTEIIENQVQLVEIQNQQQQDREMELNRIMISTSRLNKEDVEAGEGQDEVIKEQKLEMKSEQYDSQPQQTGVVETQLQPSEVKRKSGQDKTMSYRKTRSASAPTATIPPVDPSGKVQVELEELSELPIKQVFPGLKSPKKEELSVPQQQENDHCPLQKRKLRSHNRPNMHELATDTTILEPLKHRAQGTPPILGTVKDAIMQVVQRSDVQGQNEQQQQSQGRFSRRLLRSNDKKASVSEPAAPTMTLSSTPTEKQQQQAQHKVLEKRGRPCKLKTEVEEKPAKCRGQGRPHKPKTELEEKPPKGPGRGRPRKPKTELEEKPPKWPGRGRPPKPKPDTVSIRKGNTSHQLKAEAGL
ncbi:Histone H [Trema orientale]|uniref:Histone H n=1 Tax=Trema orientale TaxID=63057 RepID=A0A2P5D780_TREOI|nr:Histone H [Trema orientale]